MTAGPLDSEHGAASSGALRGHLRSTLKHGLIYGLGTLLAKAIGFIMIPIYTRVLTPADYGILELLSTSTDIIALVAGIGLSWGVTRYYYYYDEERERHSVVSSAAMLVILFFALAALAVAPLAEPAARLLLGHAAHAGLVRLAILSFFLSSLLEVPFAFLRAKQDSTHVVMVGLGRLVLALGLNVWFVVILRWGVAGVLYSAILTSAAAGSYLMFATLRETGLRFSGPIARKLLAYGFPLVGANVGSFVLHYSDRYFLRAYDSLESVGLYSLAYKFAMLLSLLVANPFAQIWAPKALEIQKDDPEGAPPVLRRILCHYNAVLVAGALGLALFAGEVIRVMADPEFYAAERTVPILCVAMLFFGYRQLSYVGAVFRERSDVIGLGTLVAAGIAIAGNFALIPRWGPMGAAVATAFAFATEFAVVMVLSERMYALRYPILDLFGPVLLAGLAYAGTAWVLPDSSPLALRLCVKGLALLLFVTALVVRGDVPGPRAWAATLKPLRYVFAEHASRHR